MLRFPTVTILAACFALSAGDLARLQQLEEKERIFDLRDALDAPGQDTPETLLYRALTNSRFGREREAVAQFRAFLATHPSADLERKARSELGLALTRLGELRDANAEFAIALRLTPAADPRRANAENSRAFMSALDGVPPQTVEFGSPAPIQARRNEFGLWVVPLEINSQRGEWILDTGASISTISQSEARRMGIAVRDIHANGIGYTGAKVAAGMGVVGEIRLGYARLRNVAVMVVSDADLRLPPSKTPISGILGIPPLRALGCLDLSAKGELTFDCGAKPAQGAPNVFFDGLAPLVRVLHQGRSLQLMLDTGTPTTVFYPAVRETLAAWELNQLSKPEAAGFAGAGGVAQIQASYVPNIELAIQGRTLFIQGAKLFNQTLGAPGLRDGILGLDAIPGGFRLDFQTMQFSLK